MRARLFTAGVLLLLSVASYLVFAGGFLIRVLSLLIIALGVTSLLAEIPLRETIAYLMLGVASGIVGLILGTSWNIIIISTLPVLSLAMGLTEAGLIRRRPRTLLTRILISQTLFATATTLLSIFLTRGRVWGELFAKLIILVFLVFPVVYPATGLSTWLVHFWLISRTHVGSVLYTLTLALMAFSTLITMTITVLLPHPLSAASALLSTTSTALAITTRRPKKSGFL